MMFRILLKKQMTEIFRAYFYDAKKNKKRSVFSTVLFFGFFIILMVGIVGGMFAYLADSLCKPFAMVNMKWLYFLIMGMIAIALGTFGSVFNTYSGLYLSKDNDLLLSMPIPIRSILTIRLVSVYLMGLMYSAIVMLPAVIVYWIEVEATPLTVVGPVLLILLILPNNHNSNQYALLNSLVHLLNHLHLQLLSLLDFRFVSIYYIFPLFLGIVT